MSIQNFIFFGVLSLRPWNFGEAISGNIKNILNDGESTTQCHCVLNINGMLKSFLKIVFLKNTK